MEIIALLSEHRARSAALQAKFRSADNGASKAMFTQPVNRTPPLASSDILELQHFAAVDFDSRATV
ncbi:hypothetical protein THIX_50081 [Thiomonas sp. X19]|nr:hypothetical protein THIX_30374 [Thiomonas sp. X19]SCC93895.1 hypothetical protein THIX_50081 [Thiomonas sp. X19]